MKIAVGSVCSWRPWSYSVFLVCSIVDGRQCHEIARQICRDCAFPRTEAERLCVSGVALRKQVHPHIGQSMPFLVCIAVIVVGLSTVLLELDWLTKPSSVNKPATQVASTSVPPTAPAAKANGSSPELSPTYPTNPNSPRIIGPAGDTAQSAEHVTNAAQPISPAVNVPLPMTNAPASIPAAAETTGTVPQQKAAVAATTVAPPPTTTTDTTSPSGQPAATSAAPPQPNPQAVAQHTKNSCDVQACSGGYRSFRVSDCTYQPLEGGARRVCMTSPGSGRKVASQPAEQPTDGAEGSRKIKSDMRKVREITEGSEVHVGDEVDIDPETPDGSRMIVIHHHGSR